jgi:hypothetical protein
MPGLDDSGATLQDLQGFLQAPGCAVCRAVRQSADRYFSWLLYEGANDPEVHARLEAGGAFCAAHAGALAERRDPLATALIYGNLLRQRLRTLQRGRAARALPSPGMDCPACAIERQSAERATAVFAAGLKGGALTAAWQASAGLCWPHFVSARRRLGGRARATLEEVEAGALGRLDAEVQALVDSFDYRSTAERTPQIASAWRRAVDAVVGRPVAAERTGGWGGARGAVPPRG